MHRDIKLDNMMCTNNGLEDFNIKLTDFGFSMPADMQETKEIHMGTVAYMAPELCKQEKYDERVDTWSTGIVAYYLLAGEAPFMGNDDELKYQIINNELPFYDMQWKNISEDARDFVRYCCTKDLQNRPTILELL